MLPTIAPVFRRIAGVAAVTLLVAPVACSTAPATGSTASDSAAGACPRIFPLCVGREKLVTYFKTTAPGDASADAAGADGSATLDASVDGAASACPSVVDFVECAFPGCPHFPIPDADAPFDVGTCRRPLKNLPSQGDKCCYEVEDRMACPNSCG